MIKVQRIRIQDFRGIRDLTLDLNQKSFAVAGPNGTGKSGIVDALEFGLTGTISRLTGVGRGDVSVKEHGPHVDSQKNPEKAMVTLDVFVPSLNKNAQIVRSVKAPRSPKITPSTPEFLYFLKQVEQHPEIVLSRREIIKYVLAEPGKRADEVQALLQLDKLEKARATIQKIANSTEKETGPLEQVKNRAVNALLSATGIAEIKQDLLLEAANKRRKTLGLSPLAKLEATTSLRDGLDSQEATTPARVSKVQANADLDIARKALAALSSEDFLASFASAREHVSALVADEKLLQEVSRETMLQSALELFDEKACPVCETHWSPNEFRNVVSGQLKKLEQATKKRKDAETRVAVVVGAFEAAIMGLASAYKIGNQFEPAADTAALVSLGKSLREKTATLKKLLPLQESLIVLEDTALVASAVNDGFSKLNDLVSTLPEPSERDAARDFLMMAQEKLIAFRDASASHRNAEERAKLARKTAKIYTETTDAALEAIYKDVEQEFRSYYRAINGEDEKNFSAQLTPSMGKLGFQVDFYGRGLFPPGAYHSEGHQDGMGLCLYLALMKYILGDEFRFAVLDDVLMSVDTGHRREVSALLKDKFPNTQFVLTTHDSVWLRHMKTAKLIEGKQAIEFRKWSVDSGPSEWKTADVWSEIDAELAVNNVKGAAGLLRNHLEYMSAEMCDRLGGMVEFKGDGRYDLGGLLPPAVAALRELLKKAKAAANSWNNQTMVQALGELEGNLSTKYQSASVDQWQINPAIHYNEWANLTAADFKPVVAAFRELEQCFECATCNDNFYIAYEGKTKDTLRCGCSSYGLITK